MSLPILTQSAAYHQFAEQGALFGIPSFANVISNAPFLLVAIAGWRAGGNFREAWERTAYATFLAGCALVTFGSAYFHLAPSDARLFWDRLPMTILFLSLLAAVLGDRVHPAAGRRGLWPLLGFGIASVVYWRATGDLSLYAVVQLGAIAGIAVTSVLRASHYTYANRTVWAMIGLYGLAKLLEHFDLAIGLWIPTGGHPLKHLAAAAALWVYVEWVKRREVAALIAVGSRLAPGSAGHL